MVKVEYVWPKEIRLKLTVSEGSSLAVVHTDMLVDAARRLAAELLVAAERAERLESDQRAPG